MELALAVVPLVIAAAEHYKTTYDALRRLQRSSREAESLRVVFRVQRAIFQDNCKRILIHCGIESSVSGNILERPSSTVSSSEYSDKKYETILGDFLGPLKDLVNLIILELSEIQRRLKDHGTKMLALLRPDLDKNINQIRLLNSDLNHIRTSLDTSRQEYIKRKPMDHRRRVVALDSQHTKELKKLGEIRELSQALYIGLTRACKDHSQHETLLSLVPQTNRNTKRVKFELALRSHSLDSDIRPDEDCCLWISVEAPTVNQKPVQTALPLQTKAILASTGTQSVDLGQSLHRVKGKHNARGSGFENGLCRRVREMSELCTSRSCIGSLEEQLEVFLVPLKEVPTTSTNPESLVRYFERSKTLTVGRAMNDLERVKVAHDLATSVLLFHSTPWMLPSWNIDQILLLGNQTPEPDTSYRHPELFIDVTVSDTEAKPSLTAVEQNTPIIENPFLYRLGVILLELAFEKPLRELRGRANIPQSQDNDLATAYRCKSQVSRLMGRDYAKIVDQCLKCSFGCGQTSLDSASLQMDVYCDVLWRLKSLEMTLQSIWA